MLAPLQRSIEVECGQHRAFEIFIERMESWWPLAKYSVSAMGGKKSKELRVEAKAGGKITEITADGREYLWGIIRVIDAPRFLSMEFHIPLPDETVEDRSLVEVTFTVLSAHRTRVDLKQSNWEAFGKRAEMLQGGYGKGWLEIFDHAFAAACHHKNGKE